MIIAGVVRAGRLVKEALEKVSLEDIINQELMEMGGIGIWGEGKRKMLAGDIKVITLHSEEAPYWE